MSTDLTIREDQHSFTDQQVAALRQLGVQDATPADLDVFFHVATRSGLDPFARQIYLLNRRERDKQGNWHSKQTIQTGIDGFRLIARRAADTRRETFGEDDVLWCGSDGKWVDVWLSQEPPAAAKVTVHRGAGTFSAVALLTEYAATYRDKTGQVRLTSMWRQRPAGQLAKCAEALALRKAFPQDLSGLYTTEEMQQGSNPEPAPGPAHHRQEQLDVQQRIDAAVSSFQAHGVTLQQLTDQMDVPRSRWGADELDALRTMWQVMLDHEHHDAAQDAPALNPVDGGDDHAA